MKHLRQNPTARIWFLSGLTGMVLMAGVLLGEGQARVSAPSSVSVSVQSHALIPQTTASHRLKTAQTQSLSSSRKQPAKDFTPQDQLDDKKLEKKRMGLAMLFIGILAEEG